MPEDKIVELDAWKNARHKSLAQNVADATQEPTPPSSIISPKHDLADHVPDQTIISQDDLKNADLKIPKIPDQYKTVRLMDNVPVLEDLERDWVSKVGFGKSQNALEQKIEAMNKKRKARGMGGSFQLTSTKKAA